MGKTLVIIGNGFDLAHHYHTCADDFENSIDSSPYKDFEENTLSMDWTDIKLPKWWNEYETRIGKQLGLIRTADEHLSLDTAKYSWDGFLSHTNQIYDKLTAQLSDYLRSEYSCNVIADQTTLKSIKKLLHHPHRIITISFNYTDTAKRYISNTYHLHGSLKEDNIVLGFDHVGPMRDYKQCDISDVDEWKLIRRNKRYQRIMMEFQRYCVRNGIVADSYQSGLEMLECFLANRECNLSGEEITVGIDDTNLKLVNKFLNDTKIDLNNGLMPVIPFKKIREIVVLGHSLESDQRLLDDIICRCCNVHKVIIYSYEGEPDEKWKEKEAFFMRLKLFRRHRKKRNRIKFVREYY